jgi:hypothetical protein
MKTSGWVTFTLASALATAGAAARAQPPPAPPIPAQIAAMLKAHLGKRRAEGTITANGQTQPAAATWECVAAVGGIGLVCTWMHEWPGGVRDRAVEIIGYDAATSSLRSARVTDRGIVTTTTVLVQGNTMTVPLEGTQNGVPYTGLNVVSVAPGGDWTQQLTIDSGGQRVYEMKITHRRVE